MKYVEKQVILCGLEHERLVGSPPVTDLPLVEPPVVEPPVVEPPVMRLGLLGCGTVGAALVALLHEQAAVITDRTGVRLEVTQVAVRDLTKHREVDLAPTLFTDDPAAVVAHPDVDIVVEVMGGVTPAKELVLAALAAGKPVVTGNKELLARAGAELFAAAADAGVDLLFEAAVAGGIPLVRALRESLLGEPIQRVMGIVNGTTNYILTKMAEEGAAYADVLAEAQSLGYAEADPAADVDGHDAASKCAIIASIAFGVDVTAADVACEGITAITATDIAFAARHGYAVKLLAIAELLPAVGPTPDAGPGHGEAGRPRTGPHDLSARVHPAFVPTTHPLASVRESFNAVFVEGAAVGDLMFYGRGAGGGPTASAVLGDVIDAAVNRHRRAHAVIGALGTAAFRSTDALFTPFYLRLDVADRPGVLAAVAGVFGTHGVSISSMEQSGTGSGADLVFLTHAARERNMRATLVDLGALDVVRRVGSVIRVLDPHL